MIKKITITSILFSAFIITLFVIYLKIIQDNEYFTFIVLPDTQMYSMNHPQTFFTQTRWIVNNQKSLNIKFVSHVGDIVQSGSLETGEWQTASDAMSILDNAQIPYGIAPGNHDVDLVDDTDSSFKTYNTFFPLERYINRPWFGGNFKDYQNSYHLIHIDNLNFLFVNIEVDPSDEVLEWADNILKENNNYHAVVTTHAYLKDTGQRSSQPHFRIDGNSGQDIWTKLIHKNCNVFLVLSGHFHEDNGEASLATKNECAQDVYQITQDYQARNEGGDGLLRIYKFYPKQQIIKVSTYSPNTGRYERGDHSEFTIPFVTF